jgi:hypothetical protein
MGIILIDVPDSWGMFLSRKTIAYFGGNIQMDSTYDTIPTPNGDVFKLNRELERRYNGEEPRNPRNELKYKEDGFGNYVILAKSLGPI